MKKVLAFLMLSALILVMVGCASPRKIMGDCREVGKLTNDMTISDCAEIKGYKL